MLIYSNRAIRIVAGRDQLLLPRPMSNSTQCVICRIAGTFVEMSLPHENTICYTEASNHNCYQSPQNYTRFLFDWDAVCRRFNDW